jgi:puromycin-sensitive aminopeptidase
MLLGFYRAQILNTDEFLACTQFQACDARRAFPCWDEPAIKATFKVTLYVDPKLLAISNMPVIDYNILNFRLKVRKSKMASVLSSLKRRRL